MRPSNKSRSRNKPGSSSQRRGNVGNIVNRVFESAGPDGKVRGTPQQVIEKYQGLARDAQVSGDRVAAESYLQHAEHYARMLSEAQQQTQEVRQDRDDGQREDGQRDGGQRDGQRDGGQREDAQRDEGQREPAGREPEHAGRDRREGRRPQGDERPQRRAAKQPEPAGLTTLGDDEDRRGEAGPVETPESAAWSGRPDEAVPHAAEGAPARSEAVPQVNGAHHEAPQEPAQAPQEARQAPQEAAPAEGEAPPKRPRRRRTTKQAAEAPAD